MRSKKFIFSSLILFYSVNLHAQSADEIIHRYVDFIGGQKKWRSIKTIVASGEYDYGGMKFPFTTYSKAPSLYKFIVPLNGKYYAQAFDGKQGWKIDAFKNETMPIPLKGREASAMANEADIELEPVFINYQQKGHRAILEGKDSIDKRSCFKIKFVRKTGETETYYFDALTTALILKIAPSKNAEMQGAILNTMFSDYRDIGGIKIPFKSISRSGDQNILTITVEKATLNEVISDQEFQPKR